jgi:predicted  nucleic acid-binding Zn-ribbon protein
VPDLQPLLALQRLDTAADQARHRKAHLPERDSLRTAQLELASLSRRAGEVEGRVAEIETAQETLERDIDTARSRITEIDRRSRLVSVPKELQALEHERTSLSGKQRTLEDAELELMEELETLTAERDRLVEDIATASSVADTATIALAEAEASVEADLNRLVAERAVAVSDLPPESVANYDRLRPKFGGVAVASLEHGVCTGCRLQLPATELDHIRQQPPDALINCEQCGRILVR